MLNPCPLPLHHRCCIISTILLCVFLSSLLLVSGKQNEGYDLEPGEPIRVGVKKRINAKECKVKSKKGDMLSVHYVGILYKNNEEFDSTRERDEPYTFILGKGHVIEGWDRGLLNMCIGEIRKLTVPSELAYQKEGAPPKIHPDATLVFEVELMDITEMDESDYYELSHFTEF